MKKTIFAILVLGLIFNLTACVLSHSRNNVGVRVSSLEESPNDFTADIADRIIESRMQTMTIDYDCFSLPACRAQVVRIKTALPGIKIRIYVNPMELFANDPDLEQRPVQNQITRYVRQNRENYYLHQVTGDWIVWWTGPQMHMLNLSSQCPRIEGQVWSEYLIDTIYDQIYLPNRNLIDGIELDNLWPYVSFVNEEKGVQIDLNNDGQPEDFWTLDHYWREGTFHMIDYIRQKFPSNFIVTGRAFHYRYVSRIDGLTFEHIFEYGERGIQGGNFSKVDRWIRLSRRGSYYTWNIMRSYPENDMTQYAISLLGDGYFTIDRGAAGHGIFQPYERQVDLGQPLGPAQYPYQVVFDSNQSTADLQGEYSVENNWIRLNPGQKISLNVEPGQMVQFYYQIIGGQYCSSDIRFVYPGMPDQDRFDAHRWQDGEYYATATEAGQVSWTFTGPGYAMLTNIIVRDTNVQPGYFMRRYERGIVFYNPGEDPLGLNVAGFEPFRLEPGQGKIVVY